MTDAADKLRIGYGAPSVTMAPLWIAQEGKLFARNGLDVEVLYLESALVQRALIAGEISFGEMTGARAVGAALARRGCHDGLGIR